MHVAWRTHRGLCRITGTRLGLSRPRPGHYGLLRLHTVGRRTGRARAVVLAYYEDGEDLVVLAMNGWADPPPAWWLNLQARPETVVDLVHGRRAVRAREAHGEERDRLWAGWAPYDDCTLDAHAAQRSRPTPVIVLESTG